MGVRGLQTFIERYCPADCFTQVNIERLAEEYVKENPRKKPVIVFDGASILRFLYEGLDWVAGGQFTEYLEKLENFVTKFKEINIHPIFFFAGIKHDVFTFEEWEAKNLEKINKVQQLFQEIRNRAAGDINSNSKLFRIPTNIGLSHYFQEKLDVEVHIVTRYESELAKYARENRCLAIFAQDSDFLIYEGAEYYLSALHFDIDTMTTRHYDRRNLARFLKLRPSQLPIFAALVGSNPIRPDDLKAFHLSLCRGFIKFERLFPALVRYIENREPEQIFETLSDVAKDIFHDQRKADILERSIRSYLPIPPAEPINCEFPQWDCIIKVAEDMHRKNLNSAVILNILIGKPYRFSTVSEDFNQRDLPPVAKLMRDLRESMYGILLMEKPPELMPQSVEEWSVEEGPNGIKRRFVEPTSPSDHHPGLLALWGDDRSKEMEDTRWKLFVHAISPRLNHDELQDLPDHLVLPTLVLFYLKEKGILKSWEIKALLATTISLRYKTTEELQNLSSDPIDVRAVHIGAIFMRALQTTVRLLSTCGFPFPREKVFQYAYFDGKLFQKKYQKAKNRESPAALCENEITFLETYKRIYHLLYRNA